MKTCLKHVKWLSDQQCRTKKNVVEQPEVDTHGCTSSVSDRIWQVTFCLIPKIPVPIFKLGCLRDGVCATLLQLSGFTCVCVCADKWSLISLHRPNTDLKHSWSIALKSLSLFRCYPALKNKQVSLEGALRALCSFSLLKHVARSGITSNSSRSFLK